MRINVYAEELTGEVELVRKRAETGIVYYGVRVFMESPDVLHHEPDDDDRTAITFWIPWTKKEGHDGMMVTEIMDKLSELACDVVGFDPFNENALDTWEGDRGDPHPATADSQTS